MYLIGVMCCICSRMKGCDQCQVREKVQSKGDAHLKAWLEQSFPEGFTHMTPNILRELKKNHIVNLHM